MNLEGEDDSDASVYRSNANASEESQEAVPVADDIRLNHTDNELDFSDATRGAHEDTSSRPTLAWTENEASGAAGPSGSDDGEERASSPGQDVRQPDDACGFSDDADDASDLRDAITASQELQSAFSCIDDLVWHASDSVVRPIAQNKRIERQQGSEFDPKQIPFTAIPLHEVLELNQDEMENLLTVIYQSLAGNSTVNEKINVLSYFETLCSDANAANMFVNSSLMSMLVSLMRASKAALIRTRVASVIGVLTRHATYISEDLVHTKIVQVLADGMKDSSERVRRKSAAAFGELLFYISTQQQDVALKDAAADVAVSSWSVSAANISSMCRLLRPGEDETAMHYAAKTIENIATLGGPWTDRFATIENAQSLMSVFQTTGAGDGSRNGNTVISRSENFRGTVASTLARLSRSSDVVLEHVAEKGGSRLLLSGMRDRNSKVQQSFLGIALTILIEQSKRGARGASPQKSGSTRPIRLFAREERGAVGALESLLAVPSAVVKGKALLCCSVLVTLYPRWLLRLLESKYAHHIDRGLREGTDVDSYLHRCASAAQRILVQVLPGLFDQIRSEVARKVERASSNAAATAGSRRGPSYQNGRQQDSVNGKKEPPSLVPIIVHIVTTPTILDMVSGDGLICLMCDIMSDVCSPGIVSLEALKDEVSSILRAMEAVCHRRHILIEQSSMVIRLADMLLSLACRGSVTGGGARGQRSDFDEEVTVMSMKLVADILVAVLHEPAIYRPDSETSVARSTDNTSRIDAFLSTRVIPAMPALLDSEEPVPVYALKLLAVILGSRAEFAAEAINGGLLPRLADFLSLNHPNNNVHNAWACSALVTSNLVRSSELLNLRIPEKITRVVAYAFENAVEAFLEPSIRILSAMIRRVRQRQGDRVFRDELLLLLLQNLGTFVELVVGEDEATGDQILECISTALDIAGSERIAADVVNKDALFHLSSSMRPSNSRRILSLLVKSCGVLSDSSSGDEVDIPALSHRLDDVKKALEDVPKRWAHTNSERKLAAELMAALVACSRGP